MYKYWMITACLLVFVSSSLLPSVAQAPAPAQPATKPAAPAPAQPATPAQPAPATPVPPPVATEATAPTVSPVTAAPAVTAPAPPVPALAEGAAALADWPMAMGGPQRYSVYPGSVDASQLALSWQYAIPSVTHAAFEPIVVGGVLYCAVGSSVYAFNTISGELMWSPYTPALAPGATSPPLMVSSPAYSDGYLFVGTSDDMLHVLKADTGKDLQDIQLRGSISSPPAAADGLLLFGTDNGAVQAYHLPPTPDGKLNPTWSVVIAPSDPVRGPVAMVGDIVYACTAAGRTAALNRKTGAIVFASGLNTAFSSGPVVTNTAVYVTSGANLYNLLLNGLQQRWAQAFAGEISSQPAYANGILYITTVQGNLYAFDPGRRAVVWAVALGESSAPRSSPVVAGDSVLVTTSNGHAYGFATRGDGRGHPRLLWRYLFVPMNAWEDEHPGEIPDLAVQPILYGNNVYLLADNGNLDCMSTTSTDNEGPTIDDVYPKGTPTQLYWATPPPPIVARVRDIGSGLLSGSLHLILDGAAVQQQVEGAASSVGYTFNATNGTLRYVLGRPYSDGKHTVEVIATDNRHNTSDASWEFTVSHTVQAPLSPNDTNQGPYGGTPGAPGATGGGGGRPLGRPGGF